MQGRLQVLVFALFPDRPVERQIPSVNLHPVFVLDFSLEALKRFSQFLFGPRGQPARCISHCELFEHQTDLRYLLKILDIDLRDEASLERDLSDEAFVLQLLQRFADSGLRDFEASSQLLLEESVTGLEMSGDDLFSQMLTDSLRA